MKDVKLPFQASKSFFEKHVLDDFSHSQEYKGIVKKFDEVLILGDRLIEALKGDNQFYYVQDFADSLLQFAMDSGVQPEDLLRKIEVWLKAIHRVTFPESWQNWKDQKNYNLPRVIGLLELLPRKELFLSEEQYESIDDGIRQLIFIAKTVRNPVTHLPSKLHTKFQRELIPAILAAIVSPLYKHFDEINKSLHGLITSDLSRDPGLVTLIKQIASERNGHLEYFGARDKLIQNLLEKLAVFHSHTTGEYLLLSGGEGSGKSAICSKITEELVKQMVPQGSQKRNVRRLAPWLPGCLLHFGKQSNLPHEIVGSIVAQANTLIINKVSHEELEGLSEQDDSGLNSPLSSKQYLRRQSGLKHRSNNVFRTETKEMMQLYNRVLYQALDHVVAERGQVILIIDALDEISSSGSGLSFLPKTLPVGAKVLLTVRRNTPVEAWLKDHLRVTELIIPLFDRSEIPLVTKVEEINEEAKQFNDRVWEASNGWPLRVAEAAREVREKQWNSKHVNIDNDDIYRWQADKWHDTNVTEEDRRVLSETLLLLSIFEPVAPLDLASIQVYLEHFGLRLRQPELHFKLKKHVGYQLQGLDLNRVKLRLNAFADFVRNHYYSRHDRRSALRSIVEWLSEYDDIPIETIARFLFFWTDFHMGQDGKCCKIAETLPTKLWEKNKIATLYEIAIFSLNEKGAITPSGMKCLKLSAEAGYYSAENLYSSYLLDGYGIEKNTREGEHLLRKAAMAGHKPAMCNLGIRLLDGAGLEQDIEEGERWLRRAAKEGHNRAMTNLGGRLLDGNILPVNVAEGEKWLKKAVQAGYYPAMDELGQRLLDGKGLPEDLKEGERLLREAAEAGFNHSMFMLGSRLLDGAGLTQNVVEGERWLKRAAIAGYVNAMSELGERYLDGNGLSRDREKGEEWLRNAVAANYPYAIDELGQRLLDGKGLPRDQEEGEKWLRKAAQLGYEHSMYKLGLRLLDGNGLTASPQEGRRWLRRAAAAGYVKAMSELASRLLDGRGIPKNQTDGENWLRKAVNAGDAAAACELGIRLLNGDGLKKNKQEGEKWLREAADLGDATAIDALAGKSAQGDDYPGGRDDGDMG